VLSKSAQTPELSMRLVAKTLLPVALGTYNPLRGILRLKPALKYGSATALNLRHADFLLTNEESPV